MTKERKKKGKRKRARDVDPAAPATNPMLDQQTRKQLQKHYRNRYRTGR